MLAHTNTHTHTHTHTNNVVCIPLSPKGARGKNVDTGTFRKELESILETVIDAEGDFQSNYSRYKDASQKLVDKHAPVISRNVCERNKPPWIDEEYIAARKKRRKFEKVWKKSRSDEDRKRYIEQRELCAELSLSKQETYY